MIDSLSGHVIADDVAVGIDGGLTGQLQEDPVSEFIPCDM